GAQRREFGVGVNHAARHLPGSAYQRDALFVARQTVEVRTVEAGEGFQPVERAGLFERLCIQLDRRMRGEAAGTTAGRFLVVTRMRRAVGAEEELVALARRRGDQGFAMLFALEHRQAVVMRPDAALENGIAVVEQMMRGDGGADVRPAVAHERRGVAGGDVFEYDAQPGEAPHDVRSEERREG